MSSGISSIWTGGGWLDLMRKQAGRSAGGLHGGGERGVAELVMGAADDPAYTRKMHEGRARATAPLVPHGCSGLPSEKRPYSLRLRAALEFLPNEKCLIFEDWTSGCLTELVQLLEESSLLRSSGQPTSNNFCMRSVRIL